jgi:hypothetical protein
MSFSTEVRENRAFAAEIKFLVPVDRVEELRAWARARLRPDPFGSGPYADTYQSNSLYFDTAAFDVFRRNGSYGRSKYRARRYGLAKDLFLERKLKTHNHVSKRRSIIDLAELPRIATPDPSKGWAGHWFHRRILMRELAPVCQVAYTRTALVHANGHGPIRMTLDVDLHAIPTRDLAFRDLAAERSLIGAGGILELKFYHFRPPVFDELIDRFALVAQPISKYRIAIGSLYATEVAVA